MTTATLSGTVTVGGQTYHPTATVNLPDPPTGSSMLMGCSNSTRDHGGLPIHLWPAVRVYSYNQAKSIAGTAGCQVEIFALTDGGGVYTGYQATYDNFVSRFEDFYYSTGSAARRDRALHVCNGNEYADKVTGATTIAAFVDGCRGIYDASRRLNTDGTRRYPLVKVGLDPTHNQEFSGIVAQSLHPAAQWLDFVAWSMYTPGRESTSADPTFTMPSRNVADRTDRQDGFLVRCYYRTQQASIAAGKGPAGLGIQCWEIGIGDDPADSRHRPYYSVRTLAWTINQLALDFGVSCETVCWWDNQVGWPSSAESQNILSDEPAGTSPSTRVAWLGWAGYEPRVGGTLPANWVTVPAAWNIGIT